MWQDNIKNHHGSIMVAWIFLAKADHNRFFQGKKWPTAIHNHFHVMGFQGKIFGPLWGQKTENISRIWKNWVRYLSGKWFAISPFFLDFVQLLLSGLVINERNISKMIQKLRSNSLLFQFRKKINKCYHRRKFQFMNR